MFYYRRFDTLFMKSVEPLDSQLLKDVSKNLAPRSMYLAALSSLTNVPAVRPADTISSIAFSMVCCTSG